MKNWKKIFIILVVKSSFLYAPEFEFFSENDSQHMTESGKRLSGEESSVVRRDGEGGEHPDSALLFHREIIPKKKRRVQWVPEGSVSDSDENESSEQDDVVVQVKETFSPEEAAKIREETERIFAEDRNHFGEDVHEDTHLQEEESYKDVSEIEAEYESLVSLTFQRLSALRPEEIGKAEEVALGKMITYLNIFKGAVAQLAETTDGQELEERISFKAKILQQRKVLIKLQEEVEKLHRVQEEKNN